MYASSADTVPNAPTSYPAGELGKMVKLGEDILNRTDTHPLTKDYVNNKLECKSCHLPDQNGKPGAGKGMSTLIGTATVFPAWSKREGTVQTLQDRINNCFMRSMNGTRPIIDSKASIAMAAYVTWLSSGLPIQMNAKRPVSPYNNEKYASGQKKFAAIQKKATHQNYINGKKIYTAKCAACHGMNGAGTPGAFPPLWGKNAKGEWLSYNTGAGMDNLKKAPVWVQSNMPLGQGGTLSDQEAADVVLYIDAQPRASFDLRDHLLPKSKMGYYNSKVSSEKHTVRSNFKDFGLNIDTIRGDHVIK
ncbi:MAG TPA: c-type cytochrome [Arcobacter sp.]|nr:c-type cytochrome [Arcobacter sp.]